MKQTSNNTKPLILMNVMEVSEYLNLPISRIRYLVFNNSIPIFKIGRSVRFSQEAIDQWLAPKAKVVKNG